MGALFQGQGYGYTFGKKMEVSLKRRAEVKRSFLFSGLLVLFCLMFSCKGSTTPEIPIPTATIVMVSSPNSEIAVGQKEQMTATVTMSDGTTKAATGTWGSDNPSVATVDQSGLVTAIKPGAATIYIDVSTAGIIGLTEVDSLATATIQNTTGHTSAIKDPKATRSLRGKEGFGKTESSSTEEGVLAKELVTKLEIEHLNSAGELSAIGNLRGTKLLNVRKIWTKNGKGNTVFDMPTYVSRVKIIGTYTGYSSNFVVWVGGDLLVNELLGTGWGTTNYEGTHLTTGGVVEIEYSSGVSWSFTEVPATTAITSTARMEPRYFGRSISGNREYKIYKRVAAGNR